MSRPRFHARRGDSGTPDSVVRAGVGPVPVHNQPGHRPGRERDDPIVVPPDVSDPAADNPQHVATVQNRLRLGTGFAARARAGLVDRLSALDPRLRGFPAGAVELELSVKDRQGRDPLVTLECWIAGRPRLVATSSQRDPTAALVEVRDHLCGQLDDDATRREPRNNRQLRQSGW